MIECTGCKAEINITESGKCPVCNTPIEVPKQFKAGKRRTYDHFAREDMLLGLLQMFEHVKEHRHITDDALEQDWLVIPMDKFLRTLKTIENATMEISEELPLDKQHHKSLRILLGVYAEICEEKNKSAKNLDN